MAELPGVDAMDGELSRAPKFQSWRGRGCACGEGEVDSGAWSSSSCRRGREITVLGKDQEDQKGVEGDTRVSK